MLLLISIILLFLVLVATISQKFNIPLILISLAIGIFFGSDITGIIYFDNAELTKEIANFALIFIIFAGGFGTKRQNLKPIIKPTIFLSTIGILLTANITAIVFSYFSGWSFMQSLLLCVIISSTDVAAVFSILRTKAINKKLSSMAELESATNDPMTIIYTTMLIQVIIGNSISKFDTILLFSWQLIGGVIVGILIGLLGSFFFDKIKNIDIGYFYILLIGLILFSFGLADFVQTSGMLSAFFAGYIMGNKRLPYQNGLASFAAILSFISNVGLFVLLGLLVFPREFIHNLWFGVLVFIILTFISRPIMVLICTLFTKISLKEKFFLSWCGVRGAVPIVLATYPAAAGIDNQHQIFNIVFIAVLLSIIIQGTSIGKLADLLKLTRRLKPNAKQKMELVTIHETDYELVEIHIDDEIYKGELKIADIELPTGTTMTMISRNNKVIAPSGSTVILPGDIISLLVKHNKLSEATQQILNSFSFK